jgi:HlyD family secretion protein
MIAGRIVKQCCREGDTVRNGQVLVELESDELKASEERAQAAIEKTRADMRVYVSAIEGAKANLAGADADIDDASAEVEKARAAMEEKKLELDRYEALYQRQIVAKATYDVAKTAYATAVADYRSTAAKLAATQAKKNAAGAQLNTARNQLKAAEADLKASEADLGVIKAKLEQTIIASPVSGTIVFKAQEAGETVSPGATILTLVDLSNLYVRIDVEETLVGAMTLGQPVTIHVEGPPKQVFQGKIIEIGRYAEFATQKDITRGRQDVQTFKVKIDVNNPTGYLKPGMTVKVEIPL